MKSRQFEYAAVVAVGCISEDRFVAYFVRALQHETRSQFDKSMQTFSECAAQCLKAQSAANRAMASLAHNADAQLLGTLFDALDSSHVGYISADELVRLLGPAQ